MRSVSLIEMIASPARSNIPARASADVRKALFGKGSLRFDLHDKGRGEDLGLMAALPSRSPRQECQGRPFFHRRFSDAGRRDSCLCNAATPRGFVLSRKPRNATLPALAGPSLEGPAPPQTVWVRLKVATRVLLVDACDLRSTLLARTWRRRCEVVSEPQSQAEVIGLQAGSSKVPSAAISVTPSRSDGFRNQCCPLVPGNSVGQKN